MTKTMRFDRPTTTAMLALLASAASAACLAAGAGPLAAASALASTSASPGGASAPASSGSAAKVAKSGIATWFGPGFYGQRTACGQTLTPAVVGVANRTLPCGTLVQVTYHGHTLTVPVLDRGPYASNGASWDLTAAAASALAVTDTARIATHLVGSAPNTPTLGSPPPSVDEASFGGAQAG